jgi:hypothetical protein
MPYIFSAVPFLATLRIMDCVSLRVYLIRLHVLRHQSLIKIHLFLGHVMVRGAGIAIALHREGVGAGLRELWTI